jgi:hypothetical protein
MAVSQGWSEWVAGWFDEISKILPNIVATPGTSVTYRTEAESSLPRAQGTIRASDGGIIIQNDAHPRRLAADRQPVWWI